MIKYILILFLTLSTSARENSERHYQDIIAEKLSGKTEHVLEDKTRIDILTKSEAIEVDFAYKWAEGIGQALHYSTMTGLDAGLILIVEKESDLKHVEKVKKIRRIKSMRLILWKYEKGELVRVE